MNLLQIRAANPEISIWVSASAGTGKTKILTDRVLRLLLQGEPLDKILCLTFTNAAAGEMKERIIDSIFKWSSSEESVLVEDIKKILGRESTSKELLLARNLYDYYIRSENSVNIQTIHSFCQKILKRFPLEADISPSFKIIDEIKAYSILRQIKTNLIAQKELELINKYLIENFHELIIDDIFSEIIQQKSMFLKKKLPVDDIYFKSEQLISKLQEKFDDKYYDIINSPIISNIVGFNITVQELKSFFLTENGHKRKRIVTQKIAKLGSNLYSDLEVIQERVYQLDQTEKNLQLEYHSQLLHLLGAKILKEYEDYKIKKGLLDYDDLISKACLLLNNSTAKEWVLYKLDGFINHLLVDEAQDTSSEQWKIIEALIADFFAGESKNENDNRTIFVVGDEKQSIFSFQGASVESFTLMNKLLENKISASGKKFENINLEISYRSAPEILDTVYNVFSDIQSKDPEMFSSKIIPLTAFRNTYSGSVELWPICTKEAGLDYFWPLPSVFANNESAKTKLARKISDYIKYIIDKGEIVGSQNRPVSAGDIMILFRRRDELTEEVIKALRQNKLEVSGLDRIILKQNLSVRDLLSVARFVLNPYDDLNLASLLKSSIINLSENLIFEIATGRGKLSIWEYLCSIKNPMQEDGTLLKALELLKVFQDIYTETESNFFQSILDIIGLRHILNESNGDESNDIINEFLYLYNEHINQTESLQSFIYMLDENESSVKRDDNSSDKIRIMTVHASKGLQAPIVILCDTTGVPNNSDRFIMDKKDNCISAKKSTNAPEYYNELKEAQKQKIYAEYLRLLYVGMTRAEDRLIICGYEEERSLPDNCWYKLIESTMKKITAPNEEDILIYGNNSKNNYKNLGFTNTPEHITELFRPEIFTRSNFAQKEYFPLPQNNILKPQIYSPLSTVNPPEYGLIFHKILEDSIGAGDLNLIKNHPLIDNIDINYRKRMQKSIDKILANEQFCLLVKNPCKVEINLGSLKNHNIEIRRVDLIVNVGKELIIIDYKSDLNPPMHNSDIPKAYTDQLALYKNIFSEIYKDKLISTKILWLETGELNVVD